MKSFSVGIVGAGAITRNIHLPVLLAMPNVRVAWLADASAERADALGKVHGVKSLAATSPEALPDCDVVLLAIPVGARAAYFNALAARGAAVFTEKPFASNPTEHRRILGLFEPDRIGCGFMRRFYRGTRTVRDALSRGWLGPIKSIRIAEGGRSTRTGGDSSFLDDVRLSPGGALADYGCHSVDLALHVTGAASFEVEDAELAIDQGIDRQASARVRLRGSACLPSDGALLDYRVSWLSTQENIAQFSFERATIWCELSPSGNVWLGDPARPREALSLNTTAVAATTYNQAFFLEWQEFLDGVEHRRESSVSGHSALLTTELVEGIYEKGGCRRA
jgi:predicted dehydrogenase